MSEWSNSFVLVPKATGKVRLCLDPALLSQALVACTLGGPTTPDRLHINGNGQHLKYPVC